MTKTRTYKTSTFRDMNPINPGKEPINPAYRSRKPITRKNQIRVSPLFHPLYREQPQRKTVVPIKSKKKSKKKSYWWEW